jgi:hypothetical protein
MNNLLILSVLLIIIIGVLVITKEQFGNVFGTVGGVANTEITVLDPTGAKFAPFGIVYRTPVNYFNSTYSSVTVPQNTRFYKYPLLYLFDASQIPVSGGVQYNNSSYFSGANNYLRPPVSALTTVVPSGTTQYNGPTTLPSSGNYFPNIISISTLYPGGGSSPLFSPPSTSTNPNSDQINTSLTATGMPVGTTINVVEAAISGAQDNGNLVTTSQWMGWVVSPNVIQVPLTVGRTYVLGIAAQLNMNSISGNTTIPRRYGDFKYVDVVMSIDNGLVEARPGGVSNAGISFGTLTI